MRSKVGGYAEPKKNLVGSEAERGCHRPNNRCRTVPTNVSAIHEQNVAADTGVELPVFGRLVRKSNLAGNVRACLEDQAVVVAIHNHRRSEIQFGGDGDDVARGEPKRAAVADAVRLPGDSVEVGVNVDTKAVSIGQVPATAEGAAELDHVAVAVRANLLHVVVGDFRGVAELSDFAADADAVVDLGVLAIEGLRAPDVDVNSGVLRHSEIRGEVGLTDRCLAEHEGGLRANIPTLEACSEREAPGVGGGLGSLGRDGEGEGEGQNGQHHSEDQTIVHESKGTGFCESVVTRTIQIIIHIHRMSIINKMTLNYINVVKFSHGYHRRLSKIRY